MPIAVLTLTVNNKFTHMQRMHQFTSILASVGICLVALCTVHAAEDLVQASQDDAQWLMPAKNYASTRFSGLHQINTGNVKQLQVAWTVSTGVRRGHEAAPLVVGDTLYVVTPFPNLLYALDLKQAGALKWTYNPHAARAAQGVACCDVVNRGAAYADGKIIFNTLDNHTVAVDAKTGKEVWKTQLGDIARGETITMAPLVVKDKVLVGNSGGEMGVHGWLTALDVQTGKIAWRAFSTGPDKRRADRRGLQGAVRARQGSRCENLAGRCLEDRRRNGVGLDFLRSRRGFDLLRHQQSEPVECEPTRRRQPLDHGDLRAQTGNRHGEVGISIQPA